MEPMPVRDRFMRHVELGEGCHMWTGAIEGTSRKPGKGHGKFMMGSRSDGSRRYVAAHRVAWELEYGPVPDGLCVLHHCDMPRCVNPEHLFLGTLQDNVADMVAKGRHRPRGKTPVRIGERQRRLARGLVP